MKYARERRKPTKAILAPSKPLKKNLAKPLPKPARLESSVFTNNSVRPLDMKSAMSEGIDRVIIFII